MLNLRGFIEVAIEAGVNNDSEDVWVVVEGNQYTVSVYDVLGREEEAPFEASDALEDNEDHEAWEDLYSQYVEANSEETVEEEEEMTVKTVKYFVEGIEKEVAEEKAVAAIREFEERFLDEEDKEAWEDVREDFNEANGWASENYNISLEQFF